MIVKIEVLSKFLVRSVYLLLPLFIAFMYLDWNMAGAWISGMGIGITVFHVYAIRKSIVDKRHKE